MKYLSIILISIVLMSCGGGGDDPKDETKPNVIVETPIEGTVFAKSSTITVLGVLSDNEDLASCTFSLEYVTPESNTEATSVKIVKDPFKPNSETITIEGKTYTLESYEVFGPIPADCKEGDYTLKIKVTDKTGNETSLDISIKIE